MKALNKGGTESSRKPTGDRDDTAATKRTTWRTVAQTGAWAFVFWAVAIQLGSFFIDPFMTLVAALFAVGARSLRTGKRSRVIAFTVLAALVMAANLAFSGDLLHPESAGSFAPALFGTLAIGLALVGGIGLLRGWAPDRAGQVRWAAVGVFVVGVAAAILITSMTTTEPARAGDAVLAVDGFAFAPEAVEVSLDEGGLWIDNSEVSHHAFAVPELGIDVQLPAGKARRVDLRGAAPGTYDFVCSVPGHQSMTGQLILTD